MKTTVCEVLKLYNPVTRHLRYCNRNDVVGGRLVLGCSKEKGTLREVMCYEKSTCNFVDHQVPGHCRLYMTTEHTAQHVF